MFCNGSVFAYNLTDGYEVWNNTEITGTGFNENCTPAYDKDNNQLYVAISSGNSSGVYALDGSNGSVVWSNTSQILFPSGNLFDDAIRYENGSVYVLNCNSDLNVSKFVCLNSTNGIVIKCTINCILGPRVTKVLPVDAFEIKGYSNGKIMSCYEHFDGIGGKITECYERNDDIGEIINICRINDFLYVKTTKGTYKYRFDDTTGQIIGPPKRIRAAAQNKAPVTITIEFVYVTDLTGNLTCYDHNLTYIDSVNFGYPITSPPVVTTGLENDHVYITVNGPSANGSGKCCVFENGTFKSFTSFGPSYNTTQSVAIVDGYIVFGNSNGELTGFKADYIPPADGYTTITTIWNGTVDLELGNFTFCASNPPYNCYTYSWMTDVGAFYAASQTAPGFTYFVNDSWYLLGSFYVEEIDNIPNYTNSSAWFMFINDTYCEYGFGHANNTMNEGDTLKWYYAPFTYDQYWNVEVDLQNATHYIGIYVI
jgi:hypothetical protein